MSSFVFVFAVEGEDSYQIDGIAVITLCRIEYISPCVCCTNSARSCPVCYPNIYFVLIYSMLSIHVEPIRILFLERTQREARIADVLRNEPVHRHRRSYLI